MELSEEVKEQFLERVREGENRQQAAEFCAEAFADPRITGTRFKFLCNRDPAFERAFKAAQLEGRGALSERLERCAQELAFGGHWPALKFLLTTYGDQFAWARSAKVEVQGTVEISAVANVLAKYLPSDQIDVLMQTVEQRMREVDEGDQPALPPATEEKAA